MSNPWSATDTESQPERAPAGTIGGIPGPIAFSPSGMVFPALRWMGQHAALALLVGLIPVSISSMSTLAALMVQDLLLTGANPLDPMETLPGVAAQWGISLASWPFTALAMGLAVVAVRNSLETGKAEYGALFSDLMAGVRMLAMQFVAGLIFAALYVAVLLVLIVVGMILAFFFVGMGQAAGVEREAGVLMSVVGMLGGMGFVGLVLVVPMLYVLLPLALASYAAVVDELWPATAIARAWKASAGARLWMLLSMVVVGLPNIGGVIAVFVLTLVATLSDPSSMASGQAPSWVNFVAVLGMAPFTTFTTAWATTSFVIGWIRYRGSDEHGAAQWLVDAGYAD